MEDIFRKYLMMRQVTVSNEYIVIISSNVNSLFLSMAFNSYSNDLYYIILYYDIDVVVVNYIYYKYIKYTYLLYSNFINII